MAKITILQNGPAIIEDDNLIIQSPIPSLSEYTKKVAICRCGKSKNGVWCDGAHSKNREGLSQLPNIDSDQVKISDPQLIKENNTK